MIDGRCQEAEMLELCPNCGGNLVPRPVRPAAMLVRHPASAQLVIKTEGCSKAA